VSDDVAFALVFIAGGTVFAAVSWFWSVPYDSSFEKMPTGKVRSPQTYQAGRWAGTVIGIVFALLGLQFLVRTLWSS
jgi:threonine/homoserine/homoserine lactone efflux protein